MFERHPGSAGGSEGAQARWCTDPVGQGNVKGLHEEPADILSYPFVEDVDEERPELIGSNAPGCDRWALSVLRCRLRRSGQAHSHGLRCSIWLALNKGDELHEP